MAWALPLRPTLNCATVTSMTITVRKRALVDIAPNQPGHALLSEFPDLVAVCVFTRSFSHLVERVVWSV